MDSRKMTLIATVAVIAMIAVGIGFAYTAFTQNSGNTTDNAYVKVTQADVQNVSSAYKFADNKIVEFDTFNMDATHTYFQIKNKVDITFAGKTYYCSHLGSVKLVPTYEGPSTGAPAALYFEVKTSDGFKGNDNWTYFIVDGSTDAVYAYKDTNAATKTWTTGPVQWKVTKDAQNPTYAPTTVKVLYGYCADSADVTIGDDKYLRSTDGPEKLESANIVFVASSTDNTQDIKTPHIVTYNENTGTKVVNKMDISTDSAYTPLALAGEFLPPANKPVFKGWSLTTSGPVIQETIELTENTTLYAIWDTA